MDKKTDEIIEMEYDYDNDNDRWGTQRGMMRRITPKEPAEKQIDTIKEVKKFNPFHDSKGWFASSSGFKTYSANPNTKAGAMAIARSAAAGHGKTVNVHRQSYGENIRQNANWLGAGKQQKPGQKGNATLMNRIEPFQGLPGASATGAAWQAQNQAQGKTTSAPKNQPKQTQQKPAAQQNQQKPAAQQNQQTQQKPSTKGKPTIDTSNVTAKDAQSIVPRNRKGNGTKMIAKENWTDRVDGKDISGDIKSGKIKVKSVEDVAKANGWKQDPTVLTDLKEFQSMAKKSGMVMFRTVGYNQKNKSETADDIAKKTMTSGSTRLNGNGLKAYGGGLYMVSARANSSGKMNSASNHSFKYAGHDANRKQMTATVHPSAKIADTKTSSKLRSDFFSKSKSERKKYGNDVGAYIASKGYDGARFITPGGTQRYTTIYNQSALVFYGGITE